MVKGGVRDEVTRWCESFTIATEQCYAHVAIACEAQQFPQVCPQQHAVKNSCSKDSVPSEATFRGTSLCSSNLDTKLQSMLTCHVAVPHPAIRTAGYVNAHRAVVRDSAFVEQDPGRVFDDYPTTASTGNVRFHIAPSITGVSVQQN